MFPKSKRGLRRRLKGGGKRPAVRQVLQNTKANAATSRTPKPITAKLIGSKAGDLNIWTVPTIAGRQTPNSYAIRADPASANFNIWLMGGPESPALNLARYFAGENNQKRTVIFQQR